MNLSSSQLMTTDANVGTPDVSIIKRSSSAPIVISDDSQYRDLQDSKENIALHSTLRVKSTPKTANFESDKKKASAEGEHSDHENASEFQSPRETCDDFQCLNTSKNTTSHLQESVCTSSEAGSTSGQCSAAARAQYYHDKLLATLQILQNSDETIRVQAESLRLAEARIAALTDRATEMRHDLTRKSLELRTLQTTVDDDKTEKTDVSITAELQERKNVNIVNTLQSNLSVIEELYRECFYETAKQEELIDMLRDSCLDVRLMDRQKAEQLEKLKSVVHTQKWSLERCQDIAMEVDNLKMEISNFLNNSNNDSGMWEREDSLATEVSEELLDITAQLLQLRDMLTGDCTCGLQEENARLKQSHETMEIEMSELRQRVADLETALADKQHLDDVYKQQIDFREKELHDLRQQLLALEEGSKDQSTTCDTLTRQLQQTHVLLTDKTAELTEVQQRCNTQKHAIQLLKEELDRANQITQENAKIRTEVSQLTSQVSKWRSQLVESEQRLHLLESELKRARSHCRDVDDCYREKVRSVGVLQSQLEEAQARGAALCEEARRVVGAVRHWLRRMRDTNREQANKIKEQEIIINSLHQRLNDKHGDHSIHDSDPCCSKCLRREPSHLDTTEPSCSRVEERCEERQRFSESEIASCSSAPIPPRRSFKKLSPCGDRRCSAAGSYRSSGVQHHAHDMRHVRIVRSPFLCDELYEQVEQLYQALDSGYRRWSRTRSASHSR